MLYAFALDALDLEEEERIQDHLDGCDQCSGVVGNFQATAAELASSVETFSPPAELRARLMQAVSRETPPEPAAPEPQVIPSVGGGLMDNRWLRLLAPLTATAAMVLVVVAVTLNVQITNEVDDLKRENSSLQANLN